MIDQGLHREPRIGNEGHGRTTSISGRWTGDRSQHPRPGGKIAICLNKPPQTQILLKRKEESGGEES